MTAVRPGGAEGRQRIEERLSKQQREFFLREQLKIIQKELGISKDDRTSDVEVFEERISGPAAN